MRIKFWILILAATLSLSAQATSFFYDADGTQTQTIDGITIKLEKGTGSNAPAYSSYNGMKIYAGNTITIDAAEAFKNVQLVFSKNEGKDYLSYSASVGSVASGGTSTALDDKKLDVWTGETTHLVFTFGTKGQRVLYQIEVDGEPIEINPVSYVDTTSLNPSYVYTEPTVVTQPADWTFFKKEYAFISNNIRVSCPQGSIILATDTTEAYFNVNVPGTLTFEATRPMKGLAITGMVRKLFDASVDKGHIEFCSPGEFDTDLEDSPVVIITDIDATSVTLTCPKQVRCYSVRIYFDANPAETLDCDGLLEAIEAVPSETNAWRKELRDGQLLLIYQDKVFTVTGQAL